MPDILKTLILSAGSGAVASGVVVWLLKSWILERLKNAIAFEYAEKLQALEHSYNQQLEKLRAQLQSDSLKAKEELEHDRKIFQKLTSYCDEIMFRNVCSTITEHNFFDDKQYKRVWELEHYGIQDENQFVNPNLRATFQKFHKLLRKFTGIVAGHFFNTTGDRYALYPERKNSGDATERQIYKEASEETRKAGIKALDAFSEFRQTVKQTLYI